MNKLVLELLVEWCFPVPVQSLVGGIIGLWSGGLSDSVINSAELSRE